ncbi:hypothetical protein HMPREF0574_0279 [Mobiluncus curtisii subsp. curtisii ATCC 35241]|uniref:Uncharacterized protein n=3 Tax=Mobiluncus TaxID=2050 RepID=D6ZH42_MOBCV|nr:hypothetical protein HMPREF0573_11631 [Mobiluncus curtisii ATCC 43063]EFL94583.1 hypothetical protein HMPREF0574_0279 [Mobiluncus curtisii subsp. curtisii ATCC 35241]EFU82343.1 hypothetical protein HMPREF0576_0712 [Mobiluncus holmesii ATCC 35242]MCU9987471.1 RNA polymerase subunit sigma [Mobiluncus curtisii]STY88685.1 Uncharacterised protein [Mobiluncus holmesii]
MNLGDFSADLQIRGEFKDKHRSVLLTASRFSDLSGEQISKINQLFGVSIDS